MAFFPAPPPLEKAAFAAAVGAGVAPGGAGRERDPRQLQFLHAGWTRADALFSAFSFFPVFIPKLFLYYF